jgi:hypothetical protein
LLGTALKTLIIIFALGTLGTGLWAARLWYTSSKIVPIPTWAKCGGSEPGDEMLSQMGVLAGLLCAGNEVARLNGAAALWTAIAVVFGVAATLAGLWSG